MSKCLLCLLAILILKPVSAAKVGDKNADDKAHHVIVPLARDGKPY